MHYVGIGFTLLLFGKIGYVFGKALLRGFPDRATTRAVCGPTFIILKQTSKISKLANVSNAPKAANQTRVPNKVSKARFW